MNMKKIILALTGLGVLAMLFTSVNFTIEKNKHNHPVSAQNMQKALNGDEEKTAFNPTSQEQATSQTTAPKLESAALPDNIPPAMLEAMQQQGISLEDLQKMNTGNMPPQSDPTDSNGVPEKLKSDVVFPEAMLKAMEEQKKKRNEQTGNAREESASQSPAQNSEQEIFNKAIAHINSHGKQEESTALMQALASIQKDSADTNTFINVADTFIRHGEVKAAEIVLEKGIAQNPDNAILPYLYGQALSKDFRFEKAAEQWEKALSLEQSAEVHYALGMLYRYKLNNEDKAKEHFNTSKTIPAHDPTLADHLKAELEK